MKKMLLVSLFSAFLFSCNQNNTNLDNIKLEDENSNIQSTDKNFLESIEYYYSAPTTVLDKTGLSEILVRVKSLTGSLKYDNGNSATRYMFFKSDSSASYDFAPGRVRLGKDNKVYFENMNFNTTSNKSEYEYYELGTFDKSSLVMKSGSTLKLKTNDNVKFQFKGRGLNPMNHDEIHIKTSSVIKPVKKEFKDFL